MSTTHHPLRRLTAAVLLLCPLSSFAEPSLVNWSNDHHQTHFADVNGDGISDLLLQANQNTGTSSLVLGSNTSGDVRYLSSHQQALPAQLSGSHWDASQAKVTLADFNGDGFADFLLVLPQDQIALTFLSDQQPAILTAQVAIQYSADTLSWLTDADDFTFWPGDFNGDGQADLLAVSAQKQSHYLMHSNAAGLLTIEQTIKKNVKWGRNNAEKLLIGDFNQDGRDDVFALGKQQNKNHYVVFADDAGLLNNKSVEKVSAKIDDKDWNANLYSVVTANIKLVRLPNIPGGMDEEGNIVSGDDASAKTPTLTPAQTQCANLTYTVATATSGVTCLAASVPASPSDIPVTYGSNYKPVGVAYNITMPSVSGATYYQLYEAHTTSTASPGSYTLVYSGSGQTTSRTPDIYRYRWYRYKACNASGCSGLSPYRRLYIYDAAGMPNNLTVSPSGVNTGASYTLSWTYASGAVDGTVYQVYENEQWVYSVTRQHWSEHNYSFTTSKSNSGNYTYRVTACSPGVTCGTSASTTQTVISANQAPVANTDYPTLNEDSPGFIQVQANDSDAEGQPLTTHLVGYPSHGSVSVQSNMVLYTPFNNYHGSDYFTYQVRDSAGVYSNIAAVNVNVLSVNDAPTGSVVITGQPMVGQTLGVSQTLSDVDGLGALSYQWFRHGGLIASGGSYTVTAADAGYRLSVTASYVDGGGSSESVASAPTNVVEPATSVVFIHTDLLGTPVVETNAAGGLNQ